MGQKQPGRQQIGQLLEFVWSLIGRRITIAQNLLSIVLTAY